MLLGFSPQAKVRLSSYFLRIFIGHWGLEMEFLDWYRKVHVRHLKPKPDQEKKLQKIGTLVDSV